MRSPLETCAINNSKGPLARAFIDFPFRLYKDCPQWVPWFRSDLRRILDRRHPFFEHSAGEFFLARKSRETLGRIAVVENTRYNSQHRSRFAHFYFFDLVDDAEVAGVLLGAVSDWARRRKLEGVVGPGGLGAIVGAGVLIDGFEHRAAMTMMGYNYPYYQKLLERAGFAAHQNLYSMYLDADTFRLPERIRCAAEKVLKRGNFRVLNFTRKKDLLRLAPRLGQVYNAAIGDHLETYPYSENELKQVTRELAIMAEPSLIKVLAYKEEIVGFVFGFPDLSAALQRANGRLNPFTILDLFQEYKRTDRLIINGAGILSQYQRLGGNALLYCELERTAKGRNFHHVDLTQVAETTGLMLSDIQTLGGNLYKTHRVYRYAL